MLNSEFGIVIFPDILNFILVLICSKSSRDPLLRDAVLVILLVPE